MNEGRLRLSVTEMDAYRSWRDNEHEDEAAALVGLLAQLRKELLPTRPMQAGSAWHKALEHAVGEEMPGREVRDVLTQDGFTFRILADIDLALPLVAEIKGELEIQTPSGLVTLVGVVDGLDGDGIRDYKLSSYFDAERYLESYQWRCYLLMFCAQRFEYQVFVGRDAGHEWLITDYHQLALTAYPRLREDVEHQVAEFASFVSAWLPERLMSRVEATA